MVLITKYAVIEQEGIPAYFLLQSDIEFLARDDRAREEFLKQMDKTSLFVAGTEELGEINVDITNKIQKIGGGYHSKLY